MKTIETEHGRFYYTPHGIFPSVTTVLSHGNDLSEWISRVGEAKAKRITEHASERGTAVHNLLEEFVKTNQFTTRDKETIRLAAPIIRWLQTNVQEYQASEIPVYSKHLGIAGRCDLVAKVNGVRTVIDFKTADKPKDREWISDYFLQCAAYVFCLKEMYDWEVNRFIICIVDEENHFLETFEGLCVDYIKAFNARVQLFKQGTIYPSDQ